MADQIIKCRDCQQEFTFTEGEQTFYASRQFAPPKRCKLCREEKKREQEEQQGR